MPRIFDNIEQSLLPALQQTLDVSARADFCVGYFNLRGWKTLASYVERWAGGDGHCCRLLVGMHRPPELELREAMSVVHRDGGMDNQTALRLKKALASEFRAQLGFGIPTNEDEAGLRRLARQIRARKVVVKLFVAHPLHAKLYLLFRPDPVNPIVGYLGSSNLTLAGMSHQGELNVDVLDHDAGLKLARWFEDRWNDRWCIDISEELSAILENDYRTVKGNGRDGYELFLCKLLLDAIGKENTLHIGISFHAAEGKDLCRVVVAPSPRPVCAADGADEIFYARTGNNTSRLTSRETVEYVKRRWTS